MRNFEEICKEFFFLFWLLVGIMACIAIFIVIIAVILATGYFDLSDLNPIKEIEVAFFIWQSYVPN